MDPAKLPTREKAYLSPRREAAWRFVHYGGEDENESFWDKLNCANHRLNNLANQIVKPTQQALQRECEGAVPYVYTNVAGVTGSNPCRGENSMWTFYCQSCRRGTWEICYS